MSWLVLVGQRVAKLFTFNTLFSQEYFEVRLDTKIPVKIGSSSPLPVSGADSTYKKNWSHFVDLSNMHFNQCSLHAASVWEKKSPTGKYLLSNKEGSLVLSGAESTSSATIMKHTGYYNPDFGHPGITNPIWTKGERYVLAVFDNRIIVADLSLQKVWYTDNRRIS